MWLRLLYKGNYIKALNQSSIAILCLILISALIMSLGSTVFYISKNADNEIIKCIQSEGISITLYNRKTSIISNENIKNIIKDNNDMGYDFSVKERYPIECLISGQKVLVSSYIDKESTSNDYIYIPQKMNIKKDEIISIKVKGKDRGFRVKGFSNDAKAYISYIYFDNEEFIITKEVENFSEKDIQKEVKQINRMSKNLSNEDMLTSNLTESITYFRNIEIFIYIIAVILIVIALAFIILVIVNHIKIDIRSNQKTYGVYMALGVSGKQIVGFQLMCWSVYILIATISAVILVLPIVYLCLDDLIEGFFMIINYNLEEVLFGFDLISLLVSICTCFLVSFSTIIYENNKMLKNDTMIMMKGEL